MQQQPDGHYADWEYALYVASGGMERDHDFALRIDRARDRGKNRGKETARRLRCILGRVEDGESVEDVYGDLTKRVIDKGGGRYEL